MMCAAWYYKGNKKHQHLGYSFVMKKYEGITEEIEDALASSYVLSLSFDLPSCRKVRDRIQVIRKSTMHSLLQLESTPYDFRCQAG
jgi:hypothetical protein